MTFLSSLSSFSGSFGSLGNFGSCFKVKATQLTASAVLAVDRPRSQSSRVTRAGILIYIYVYLYAMSSYSLFYPSYRHIPTPEQIQKHLDEKRRSESTSRCSTESKQRAGTSLPLILDKALNKLSRYPSPPLPATEPTKRKRQWMWRRSERKSSAHGS